MRFNKYTLLLILTISFGGCATARIPAYVQSQEVPYKKKFFTTYENTLLSTKVVLEELGWYIEEEKDPSIYERIANADDPYSSNVLLITEVREQGLVVGTIYKRLNVFISSGVDDKETDVEVRSLTVTAMPFSSIRDYKDDADVDIIFKKIEESL
ncbi:MAG: hypothetical protein ACI9F2_001148 [Lysobacterales bacterium]|jgi:hypothetical protein